MFWKNLKKDKPEFELYNLANDPAETKNIAKNNPKIVAEMLAIMKKEHTDSALFPFK